MENRYNIGDYSDEEDDDEVYSIEEREFKETDKINNSIPQKINTNSNQISSSSPSNNNIKYCGNGNIEFLEKSIYSQFYDIQFSEVKESSNIIHNHIDNIVNLYKINPEHKKFTNKTYLYTTLMTYIGCTSVICLNCNKIDLSTQTQTTTTTTTTTPIKTTSTHLSKFTSNNNNNNNENLDDIQSDNSDNDDGDDNDDYDDGDGDNIKKEEKEDKKLKKKEIQEIVLYMAANETSNIKFWKHMIKATIIKKMYKKDFQFNEYGKKICKDNNFNEKLFFSAFCYIKNIKIHRKIPREITNYFKFNYLKKFKSKLKETTSTTSIETTNWFDNNNVIIEYIKETYSCDLRLSTSIKDDDIFKYSKFLSSLKLGR